VGRISHEVLAAAAKKPFLAREDLERFWDNAIDAAELEMSLCWFERALIPISESLPDYAVRRQQTLVRAEAKINTAHSRPSYKSSNGPRLYGYELPVSNEDGSVYGFVDCVLPSPSGPIMQDLKTGRIFDIAGSEIPYVIPDYIVQLKIYAALYYITTSVWPIQLEITPIADESIAINFTHSECISILEAARREFVELNQRIARSTDTNQLEWSLANPSGEVCSMCTFRPQCAPYLRALRAPGSDDEHFPKDVIGRIESIQNLHNGSRLLSVATSSGRKVIRGLASDKVRHPALNYANDGDPIGVFGLRGNPDRGSLAETKYTTIYSDPSLIADL